MKIIEKFNWVFNLTKDFIKRKIKEINNKINYFKVLGKPKIFCIGRNKTGTTSFKKAMEDLNFIVGNQPEAEKLLKDYKKKNFKAIIKYCQTAQVFQDFPFSIPETYKYLDKAFPNSKFILTIRDSADQWYNSMISHFSKEYGKDGKTPTKKDLQISTYVYPGWQWQRNRILYKTPENDPFNKEILIKHYNNYNNEVINYFKNRPNNLLIINLSDKNSYKKLMNFLEIKSPYNKFPWLNKSSDIPIKKTKK